MKMKAARWSLVRPEEGLCLLGEASSGLVAVCKSYGREGLEGGGLWSSNFNWRSAMASLALLCARSEMGEGGSRNGRGCALEPRDARALASLAAWLDELGGEWLRRAVACLRRSDYRGAR